jgi:hypothetical protein
MTAQATLSFTGINQTVWNSVVNSTDAEAQFDRDLSVDISNYFVMHRREVIFTNLCWNCDAKGDKLPPNTNGSDSILRISFVLSQDYCDTVRAISFMKIHKAADGRTIKQPPLNLTFLEKAMPQLPALTITDVQITFVDAAVHKKAPGNFSTPVNKACENAGAQIEALVRLTFLDTLS